MRELVLDLIVMSAKDLAAVGKLAKYMPRTVDKVNLAVFYDLRWNLDEDEEEGEQEYYGSRGSDDKSDADDDAGTSLPKMDNVTRFPLNVLECLPMAKDLWVVVPMWTPAMIACIKLGVQLQHLNLFSYSRKAAINAAALGHRLPVSLVSLDLNQPISPAAFVKYILPQLSSSLRSLALNLAKDPPATISWPAHILRLDLTCRAGFIPVPLPPKLQFLGLHVITGLCDQELGSWMRALSPTLRLLELPHPIATMAEALLEHVPVRPPNWRLRLKASLGFNSWPKSVRDRMRELFAFMAEDGSCL